MIPAHPYADAFPMMTPAEFAEHKESIRQHGQRERIVQLDGSVLDGRNRQLACIELGIEPRYRDYDFRPAPEGDGPDPLAFVEDLNLRRRQLDASQRAAAAAAVEVLRHGGARQPAGGEQDATLHLEARPVETRAELARRYDASERTIADAAKVRDKGLPELFEAIRDGNVYAHDAAEIASLPAERQTLLLDNFRDAEGRITPEAKKQLGPVVKELRAERQAEKKARRDQREQQLGDKVRALPSERFSIILADPEWKFIPYSEETGMDRAADNHYPTSGTAVIAARDVASIAAPDSMCALWVTDLARGLEVLKAWGFEFKSYFVWVKDIIEVHHLTAEQRKSGFGNARVFMTVGNYGNGYWNRDRDELLLIGTRGKFVAPAMGTQGESTWFAARPPKDPDAKSKHSKKPDCAHEWIEKLWPSQPKIELNARRARPGWKIWGFEAPEESDGNKEDNQTTAAADQVADLEAAGEADAAGSSATRAAAEAVTDPVSPSHGGRSEASAAVDGGAWSRHHAPRLTFLPVDDACCGRDDWPRGEVVDLPDGFLPHREPVTRDNVLTITPLPLPDDGLGIPAFLRRVK